MKELFSLSDCRVWVAGEYGLLGSALVRRLLQEPCELICNCADTVDLRRQTATEDWLSAHRPDVVIVAAAKVGGILANQTYPAEFLYDNLLIASNIVEASRRIGVRKVLLLGSSCIYPREGPDPLTEEALLTGPLEPTNQWYAIAKIAALKLGQAYRQQYGLDCISAMPTNLYGPGDQFDLATSHVVPALLRKIHHGQSTGAPSVEVWGSGQARREFLFVDDCADALVHLLKHYSDTEQVNIGSGQEVTIRQLAEQLAEVIGFQGEFVFDRSKPDGTPRKRLDLSRMNGLGWQAQTSLTEGLAQTYHWYQTELVRQATSVTDRKTGRQ